MLWTTLLMLGLADRVHGTLGSLASQASQAGAGMLVCLGPRRPCTDFHL